MVCDGRNYSIYDENTIHTHKTLIGTSLVVLLVVMVDVRVTND